MILCGTTQQPVVHDTHRLILCVIDLCSEAADSISPRLMCQQVLPWGQALQVPHQ